MGIHQGGYSSKLVDIVGKTERKTCASVRGRGSVSASRDWGKKRDNATGPLPRIGEADIWAALDAASEVTCCVPGCKEPPLEHRLPLCGNHRVCPRCGLSIDDAPRVSLSCCGFLVAMIPRRAWKIPWLVKFKEMELAEAWPHGETVVKIVQGGRVIAEDLPWLEENH